MVCLVWLVVKHRHTCMELRSCCYSCRATGSRDSQSQQQYHGCIDMTGGWGYVCVNRYIDSVASKCYWFKLIYMPIFPFIMYYGDCLFTPKHLVWMMPGCQLGSDAVDSHRKPSSLSVFLQLQWMRHSESDSGIMNHALCCRSVIDRYISCFIIKHWLIGNTEGKDRQYKLLKPDYVDPILTN